MQAQESKAALEKQWGMRILFHNLWTRRRKAYRFAPVVADIARDAGALTIAVVTLPFLWKDIRMDNAEAGLERLRDAVDRSLLSQMTNSGSSTSPSIATAFKVCDEVLMRSVKGITE